MTKALTSIIFKHNVTQTISNSTHSILVSRKQNVNAVHIAKVDGRRFPGITESA